MHVLNPSQKSLRHICSSGQPNTNANPETQPSKLIHMSIVIKFKHKTTSVLTQQTFDSHSKHTTLIRSDKMHPRPTFFCPPDDNTASRTIELMLIRKYLLPLSNNDRCSASGNKRRCRSKRSSHISYVRHC